MRKTTTEALLGNFSFPPLVLHGDPLAAALIARSPAGTLSLHTLRAALMLNSTRISTILTSMFHEGDGQLSLADFLSMLAALGLHAEGHRRLEEELFEKHLDSGNGTTSAHKLLEFVVGPEGMKARKKRREPRLVVELPELPTGPNPPKKSAVKRGAHGGRVDFAAAVAEIVASPKGHGSPVAKGHGSPVAAARALIGSTSLPSYFPGMQLPGKPNAGKPLLAPTGPRPANAARLGPSPLPPAPLPPAPPPSSSSEVRSPALPPSRSQSTPQSTPHGRAATVPPPQPPAEPSADPTDPTNPTNPYGPYRFELDAGGVLLELDLWSAVLGDPETRESAGDGGAVSGSPTRSPGSPGNEAAWSGSRPTDGRSPKSRPTRRKSPSSGRVNFAPDDARVITPLPRPAIGKQSSSEMRSAGAIAFGRAARPCALSEGAPSAAPSAALAESTPEAAVHNGGRHRSLKLPRSTRRRHDVITQAEVLHSAVEEAAERAAAEEAAAKEAAAKLKLGEKPSWAKAKTLGGLLGRLASAAQGEGQLAREAEKIATPAEVSSLLETISEVIDELMNTLSDWDSDFKGDGTVSKRDFRRALPLHGISAERHVVDALFASLLPKDEAPTAAPTAGSPSAAQHGATGTPGAAPSTSPPSPPSPVHTEKSTESKRGPTMELWLLDRGIRWAPGSKAKRSKLLAGPQAGLFQDARKTVVEQLRDALVANSMRVIDLFREWDDDGNGEITKEEFRKAIPRLGLVGHSDSIDILFDEFDLDHGGTITFRELNKQLRRDVKTEKVVRDGVKVEKGVEIADVAKLRRSIKYGLLNIVNTECFSIDLFTGERKYSGL